MKVHKHVFLMLIMDALLVYLRACAWAPSATVDESTSKDHHFLKALEDLKASNGWIKNALVQHWLDKTWSLRAKGCKLVYL